jgi:hypothetical protein
MIITRNDKSIIEVDKCVIIGGKYEIPIGKKRKD